MAHLLKKEENRVKTNQGMVIHLSLTFIKQTTMNNIQGVKNALGI